MDPLRAVAAIAVVIFAGLASAQAPGGAAGAPGEARDGSRPSDGAITGGSIAPGETGGVPDVGKDPTKPAERAIQRCNELSWSLREQCLLQQRGSSTGGTRSTDTDPSPRIAPPPQNPR
jgi:hypothetical protein